MWKVYAIQSVCFPIRCARFPYLRADDFDGNDFNGNLFPRTCCTFVVTLVGNLGASIWMNAMALRRSVGSSGNREELLWLYGSLESTHTLVLRVRVSDATMI
jgi:hypothetical protein